MEDCNYSCDYCSNSRLLNYKDLMQKGDYLLCQKMKKKN